MKIFGFDIGTTSIGFAVIEHEHAQEEGRILRLGVRVFPEARTPKGIPLNQERRVHRMVRRLRKRRRLRKKLLNELLTSQGLLPRFQSGDWAAVMSIDPYEVRKEGLKQPLKPHEFGRAIYHLAQRRHFKGRDIEESDKPDTDKEEAAKEKKALSDRDATVQALKNEAKTLGAWLSQRGRHERKRGVHASRAIVEKEFGELWEAQKAYHAILRDKVFEEQVREAIFFQRPVFWRRSTLGSCRFMPGEPLCPKGSWLSQQRRMLEKLNNLELVGGNQRPLDDEERSAILDRLREQASMTWGGARSALKSLYKARGEAGAEKRLKFNLELSGEKSLLGNAVEAKLKQIFGDDWGEHPHKQAIRDALHQRVWAADYDKIGSQRVVILPQAKRAQQRAEVAQSFIDEFGITTDQAATLRDISLPAGWEPFSSKALQVFLPELEAGIRFGALLNGPQWEAWRAHNFPGREMPTGEVFDQLPSPANKEESARLAKLRNPTVARALNELRKVTNNLIRLYGKPDLIRIELARDVGKSKREREEIQAAIGAQEKRRRDAKKDLEAKGISNPSRNDIEKWLLWKEGQERCPYTGDQISFDALFRAGKYEVEHIWPRSLCRDNGFSNKTLCRTDINKQKGNRIPFQYLGHDEDRWDAVKKRLDDLTARKGQLGMSAGKVKRFLAESVPDGFAAAQLNDTSHAARRAAEFLNRLWPDIGPKAPVKVQAVSGRVTAQLRRLWGLNGILAETGKKNRADHRHHAIDALVVACTHPGMTQRLSRYWQAVEESRPTPYIAPPWPQIRADADKAVADIVVSHRVRKKVSGPLHEGTFYGDTGIDFTTKNGIYRQFVTRKKVEKLSRSELASDPDIDGTGIRDRHVRAILKAWVEDHGGDPKKAFPPYPCLGVNGQEIRKVRILSKQQLRLMVPASTGFADPGLNHHIAIYRLPDGKPVFEIVSLFEAARRLAKKDPIVQRTRKDGAEFIMSLSPGDAVELQEGDGPGIWIVQGIASKGQVTLSHNWYAGPLIKEEVSRLGVDKSRSFFSPRVGGLVSRDVKKLSVDPIGRIRPAND